MIEPFEPDYMIASVPVYDEGSTLYTALGDWFPVVVIILTMAAMLIGAVIKIRIKKE